MDMCETLRNTPRSGRALVRKRPRSGELQLKNVCFSIGSHCPPTDMWQKHLEVANHTLKKGVFSPATPVLPKERVFLHPNSMPWNADVQKRPRSGELQLKNVCFSIGSHCPAMDMCEKTSKWQTAPSKRVFFHPEPLSSQKKRCFCIQIPGPKMHMCEKHLEVENSTSKRKIAPRRASEVRFSVWRCVFYTSGPRGQSSLPHKWIWHQILAARSPLDKVTTFLLVRGDTMIHN